MSVAKITVQAADKPLQVARADVTLQPVKQIGPLVDIPPGMQMVFNVNSVQGLVIRELP